MPHKTLEFPSFRKILVSIAIPMRNRAHLTIQCLKSILKNTHGIAYEVIIINDGSEEAEIEILNTTFKNIKILNSCVNPKDTVGMTTACNHTISSIHGKYIVYLHNDTEVSKDWLYWLLQTFIDFPHTGLVCPLVVYPDHTIENAGNTISTAGALSTIGRDKQMQDSPFQYTKPIDYISGTCFMLRISLYHEIGGFDKEAFAADFRYLDFSFRIYATGHYVYYQPKAVVIHHHAKFHPPETPGQKFSIEAWFKTLISEELPVHFKDMLLQKGQERIYALFNRKCHQKNIYIVLRSSPFLLPQIVIPQIERFHQLDNKVTLILETGTLSPKLTKSLSQKGVHIVNPQDHLGVLKSLTYLNIRCLYLPYNYSEEISISLQNRKIAIMYYDLPLWPMTYRRSKDKISPLPLQIKLLSFISKYYRTSIKQIELFLLLNQMISGCIQTNKLKKTTSCAIISRKKIFPAYEGATRKIVNTTQYLSTHFDRCILITESTETYWVCENKQFTEKSYPRAFHLLSKKLQQFLKIKKIHASDYPQIPLKEWWIENPLHDFDFKLRVLYLSCLYKVRVFQAEFYCYSFALEFVKKYIPKCVTFIYEHNIEFQRSKDLALFPEEMIARVKKFEITACNQADGVIVVSDSDAEKLLETKQIFSPIYRIPLGVDLETYQQLPTNIREKTRMKYRLPLDAFVIIFHGILDYTPNTEATSFLVNTLFPEIQKKFTQNIWLFIVGGNTPPALQKIHERIVFTGFVPEIAEAIAAADLAIVPLKKGGGTRMKILDYFAAKIPVISSSKGAEGLQVVDGNELLIRENSSDILNAIEILIHNPAYGNQLTEKAYTFVQDYSWPRLVAMNAEILKAAANSAP